MTPNQAVLLAQQVYSDRPVFGTSDSASRACVYGNSVAFPGSNNTICWLADLDALTVTVEGLGEVHSGFYDAWKVIAPCVLSLSNVDATIGHSLGAALAILSAANLCLAGKPPKEVWAFEPPRVSCDSVIADLFVAHGVKVNLYRNGLDVVTDVPRITKPWKHPADLIAIGHPSLPIINIEDHLISNVVKSINLQT